MLLRFFSHLLPLYGISVVKAQFFITVTLAKQNKSFTSQREKNKVNSEFGNVQYLGKCSISESNLEKCSISEMNPFLQADLSGFFLEKYIWCVFNWMLGGK